MPIHFSDVRDAYRSLVAAPVVTGLAVLSLALGIGANSALFSLLNGLMLKPLPVTEPDRLVLIANDSWTNPIWEQIRAREHDLFDGALAWSNERFDLSRGGQTEFVDGAYASGSLFEVLGVQAARGRVLTRADDVRGGGAEGAVAVISYPFWQRHFGGAANVIGQTLTLERVAFTVVGVAPAGFFGPTVGRVCDVYVPLAAERLVRGKESFLDGRSTWWLEIMARLKPTQTIAQASQLLKGLRPEIREATMPVNFPPAALARYLTSEFELVPAGTGRSAERSRYQTPLVALLIVAALVLLIACANIANLMLARATARRREFSIRLALGASRWRVARQVLTESLMLAAVGAAAGLVVAWWGSALLVRQLSTWRSTVSIDLSIDGRVLAFTIGVAFLTAMIFGLAPAMSLGRVAPNDALKDAGRGVTGDRRFGMRNVLVITQVALSLVLMVAAGLFLRTFVSLNRVPLGLTPAPLVIVDLNLQRSQAERADRPALLERLREAAAAVPGVSSAVVSSITPLSGRGWNTGIGDGQPSRDRMSWMNAVSPGWFETLGARVVAGRDFARGDSLSGPKVAIVNETFARRFLTDQPRVGALVKAAGPSGGETFEVIGIVSDTVYRSPRDGMVPTMFVPVAQQASLAPSMAIIVKVASGQRAQVLRGVTTALQQADANAAFTFRSFDELVGATVTQERLVAILSAAFGVLALMLAAVGLYGVMSYAVSRQRTEIGVRMALGAAPGVIMRLILSRGGILVAAGLAIGGGLSFWAARFLETMLFRLEARDVTTLVAAMMILAAVGLIAAGVPAWRASRIDPAGVLREG